MRRRDERNEIVAHKQRTSRQLRQNLDTQHTGFALYFCYQVVWLPHILRQQQTQLNHIKPLSKIPNANNNAITAQYR
jgi:lactam utilization protein B